METFNEMMKRENSAQAQALIVKWNEARREADRQREVMKQTESELIDCASKFKFGDVVKDTRNGKRFVVAKVEVSTYALKGGYDESKPWLDFNYTYRAFCKDGHVSLNNSFIREESVLEPTGEHIDFTQDGPLFAGRD